MFQEMREFEEVGAFEAKARLSELLREVSHGRRYIIKVRGKRVAHLVPSDADTEYDINVAVESMRAFPKVQGVSAKDINDMISEGRR
jgi:prevent-host-death family protein